VGDDMIEKEVGCNIRHVTECGHGFNPFSEVVENHKNVLIIVTRWRVACHKSMPHLQNGPVVMIGCNGIGGAHALCVYT
jgi:hypothetical protein